MTTQTKQTNHAANLKTQPQKNAGIGDVWGMGCSTLVRGLSAINNTAAIADELTGAGLDKAVQYREQSRIRSAIAHNDAMAALEAQLEELGLTVDQI